MAKTKTYSLTIECGNGTAVVNADGDTEMDLMLSKFEERIKGLDMPESNTEPYIKVKSLVAN